MEFHMFMIQNKDQWITDSGQIMPYQIITFQSNKAARYKRKDGIGDCETISQETGDIWFR